ncbi:unnamed protein product [Kuraishia capsulata CBS 1993]|uniref:TRP C-terminal domain-containing protein n=1 Tax=Kuraishia capsulata CBS 1993 TaxID=1382522 RepID=W6MLW9_9ASCO|nr:uncharacterized protein KUCA_T00003469001 [Kuraishia capsulata CBS 1993]CDK27491.1 unnamed protein product [Kuraishia capsulata CBS 1993]
MLGGSTRPSGLAPWWFSIIFAALWANIAKAAYVGTYPCPGVDSSTFEFSNIAVEVGYNEHDKYITYKLHTVALENITDVNATTNMYTTLHVTVEYIDHVIVDEYLRLCDFLSYDNETFVETLPLNSQEPSTFTEPEYPDGSNSPTTTLEPNSGATADTADGVATATTTAPAQMLEGLQTGSASSTGLAEPTTTAAAVARLRRRDSDSIGICPVLQGEHLMLTYWTDVGEPRTFGSYIARFSFISADHEHTLLSCSKVYATPKQPDSLILGVAILVVTTGVLIWVVNVIVMVFSPYQESSNAFLFRASTICNAPILTRMSPSIADYLRYIHYVFFMGALNLSYPGFYQPIMSSFRWSTLMDVNNGIAIPTEGHVYYAYTGNGLRGLMTSSSDTLATTEYQNFIKCLGILMLSVIFVSQINVGINRIRNRKHRSPTTAKAFFLNDFFYVVGIVVILFLEVFAIPFLVLTFYLFSAISSPGVQFDTVDQKTPKVWSIVVSIILLVLWLGLVFFFGIRYIFSKKNRRKLYSSLKIILIWGGFYHMYETGKVFFFLIDTLETFLFSLLVGAVQRNGGAQIVCIVVLELVYLLALIKISPYYSGAKMNPWKFVISSTKTLVAVLALPYIPSLNVNIRAKSNLAYAQMVMHLAIFLFLFILPTFYNLYAVSKEWIRARNGLAVWPLDANASNPVMVPMSGDDRSYRYDSSSVIVPEVDGSNLMYYRSRPKRVDSVLSLGLTPPGSPAPIDFHLGDSPEIRPSHTQRDSEAASIASEVLQLTDKRVLPGISVNHSFFPPSHPIYSKQPVDYTTREADVFYNSYRILEPDPEVKRLWESREERLNAKPAVDKEPYVPANADQVPKKQNRSRWLPKIQFGAPPAQEAVPDTEKGFHVMRPRQLVVKESHTEKYSAKDSLSLVRTSRSFSSKEDVISEKTQPGIHLQSSKSSTVDYEPAENRSSEDESESFVSFDNDGNGK